MNGLVGCAPLVAVAADVAAKLAVLEAFSEARISNVELAHRLGKDEKEVRRILDPRHPIKLPTLAEALHRRRCARCAQRGGIGKCCAAA
jgi:hypothetical protein